MKQTKKNLLAILGVVLTVTGALVSFPAIMQSRIILSILSIISVAAGLVALAFALGD